MSERNKLELQSNLTGCRIGDEKLSGNVVDFLMSNFYKISMGNVKLKPSGSSSSLYIGGALGN